MKVPSSNGAYTLKVVSLRTRNGNPAVVFSMLMLLFIL
jgi:hypothetical protein